MKGIVKWFNAKKGYGFVMDNETNKDYFVHFSGIKVEGYRTLSEGQAVEFDVQQGAKGEEATNVTPIA